MKWPAHPRPLIETKLLSWPEQPHPGSAPGRSHSWNFFTLPEPAPSPWVHQLPFFSGVPSIAGQARRAGENLFPARSVQSTTLGSKAPVPFPKCWALPMNRELKGAERPQLPARRQFPTVQMPMPDSMNSFQWEPVKVTAAGNH